MSDFVDVKLENVVKRVKVGYVGSIEEFYCKKESGVPLLRTLNLTSKGIDYTDLRHVTKEFFKKNRKSQIKRGDILIARHGDSGKACIYERDEPVQALNVVVIEPDEEKMSANLLTYFLQMPYVKQQINGSIGGSVQGVINTNKIAELLLPFSKTINYKKVEEFILHIDNKRKSNDLINKELEAMARTIYDYWFLQFDFPDENGRPYKSSGGKMVWNEELKREIPEGWNTTILQNIAECLDSYRVPLSSAERAGKKGNIPYYGATGIVDYVDESIFDGDYILMAEDGSIMDEKGNPILQRITGKAWVNNHAHVLRPIKNHGCKLLMMLLKDVQVMKIKTGSIQMKINQENMNKIVLPEIPEKLVDSINMILNNIDTQILHKEKENQELTSLRDFLLPLLMNGQVAFKF